MHSSTEQYTRELHIDVQQIAQNQIEQLRDLGFCEDDFTAAGGGLERPAHHFSWEVQGTNDETAKRRGPVFAEAVEILSEKDGFCGYIESEIIPPDFELHLPRQPFDSAARIPLQCLDLVETAQNKLADLHIKVPLELAIGSLENEFERLGCYFVETPKGNRIYTMQFISHPEGRAAFNLLTEFFSRAGGATQLTYEICDAFVRVPKSLVAPPVVRKGSLFPRNAR